MRRQTQSRSNVRSAPARLALTALLLTSALAFPLAGCGSLSERLALANGNKLYKAQKYEQAIEEYKKILARSPESWDGNYMTSVSYLALYHPGSTHEKDLAYADQAIKGFEKLLTLTPPDDETRNKVRGFYIGLLNQTGQYEKAVAYFEELLKADPKNPEFLLSAAQLYAKAGNFDKAIEYFNRRAELDPKNPEAWYTVGAVCWERSYKQGSLMAVSEREAIINTGMQALEKALSIDAEHTASLAYMNLLWREKGKVLVEQDPVAAGQAIMKADEFQKKAMAILNRKRQEAKAAEASAKQGS